MTVSEVHLEGARILGQDVLIEADIEEVGRFYTHLIVKEGGSKILVSTTKLELLDILGEGQENKRIRVWGEVCSGEGVTSYVDAKTASLVVSNSSSPM